MWKAGCGPVTITVNTFLSSLKRKVNRSSWYLFGCYSRGRQLVALQMWLDCSSQRPSAAALLVSRDRIGTPTIHGGLKVAYPSVTDWKWNTVLRVDSHVSLPELWLNTWMNSLPLNVIVADMILDRDLSVLGISEGYLTNGCYCLVLAATNTEGYR